MPHDAFSGCVASRAVTSFHHRAPGFVSAARARTVLVLYAAYIDPLSLCPRSLPNPGPNDDARHTLRLVPCLMRRRYHSHLSYVFSHRMSRSSTDVYFGPRWATRRVLDLRDWFSALRFVPSSTTHHGESMTREDAHTRLQASGSSSSGEPLYLDSPMAAKLRRRDCRVQKWLTPSAGRGAT